MVGKLDHEVIEKFKEFQEKTGKHSELYIEDVQFEEVSLANKDYFEFIKGKNHYIKKYNLANSGEVPLATGSVKNESIAYQIKPINDNDVVTEKCISFNKDGDSQVFYRDYDFLMDRHHIAVVPSELVLEKYLYFSLIPYFTKMKFGWGENVADVPTVSKYKIPIPKDLNKFYPSYKIQEAIVEFLEFWKSYTDLFRGRIANKKPIYETIKKLVVKNTFKYDKFLIDKFNIYKKNKGLNVELNNIIFESVPLYEVAKFPAMNRVMGGVDLSNNEYEKLSTDERKVYFPLVSGTVENNQIAGYIHQSKLSEKSLSNPNVITWTRINSNYFFIQERPVCTNDDSFVMDVNSNYSLKYVQESVIVAMKKKHFHWGNKAGKTVVKSVSILTPKLTDTYSSKEIQELLVEFWDTMIGQINKQLDIYKRMSEVTDIIDRAFLYRTFSKMDWSREDD